MKSPLIRFLVFGLIGLIALPVAALIFAPGIPMWQLVILTYIGAILLAIAGAAFLK